MHLNISKILLYIKHTRLKKKPMTPWANISEPCWNSTYAKQPMHEIISAQYLIYSNIPEKLMNRIP